MPKHIIITIFVIVYISRLYTMKFMTKKQKEGTIYYKWSYPLLATTYMITYFGAFAEYFFKTAAYPLATNIAGVIILFSGLLITGWSIKSVDSSWSQHIEIKKQHRLCKTGPYKYMRNPYYFGVFFELLGACLTYNGFYALIFLFIIHMPLVVYRANLEEKISLKYITDYKNYKNSNKNFL